MSNKNLKMPVVLILPIALYFFAFHVASAADRNIHTRDYFIAISPLLDSRLPAISGITLNKLAYDGLYRGLIDYIPEKTRPWVEPLWSVFWTFNLTMWPHDMGHWIRARQAGGDFVIDRYRFPFPVARMVQAPDATPAEKTLMSSGGFEINTLMRQYTENRFFQTGYRDAEDLVHSFIQSIMFPMYTILIAPTDPTKPSTWDDTYGDPVDFTKLVFEHYSQRPAITQDNKVDPELIKLYREVFWVNILTTLSDPMLYKSASVFTLDLSRKPKIINPWLYRSNSFAWSYTTRFNPGALGYEIYLTQHFQLQKNYLSAYVRYGRPFKNRGVGLDMPILFQYHKFSIGSSIEVWDQAIYGKGMLLGVNPTYQIHTRMSFSIAMHWKDQGYVVGRRLGQNTGILMTTRLLW